VSAVNLLLKFDLKLQVFADPETQEVDWKIAGMNFLFHMYCGKPVDSISKLRYTLFSKRKDPKDKESTSH
jgi:hypothetical protein